MNHKKQKKAKKKQKQTKNNKKNVPLPHKKKQSKK
jgi:hypothetical protein